MLLHLFFVGINLDSNFLTSSVNIVEKSGHPCEICTVFTCPVNSFETSSFSNNSIHLFIILSVKIFEEILEQKCS